MRTSIFFNFFILLSLILLVSCRRRPGVHNALYEAVPESAFWIGEFPKNAAYTDSLSRITTLKPLDHIAFIRQMKNGMASIDSFQHFTGLQNKKGYPLLISAHISGKDRYEFIYYLPDFLEEGYGKMYD